MRRRFHDGCPCDDHLDCCHCDSKHIHFDNRLAPLRRHKRREISETGHHCNNPNIIVMIFQ